MTATSFVQFFAKKDDALDAMRRRNRQVKQTGEVFVVTDGPEGDFALTDMATAIELGNGYVWEV